VPKKGLEPPHPCGYVDLNHARLPIPPLRHCWYGVAFRRLDDGFRLSGDAATEGQVLQSEDLLSIDGAVPYTWLDSRTDAVATVPRGPKNPMTKPLPEPPDASANPSAHAVEVIPEDLALEIRKMAHDLSNALEIIVQTSYLLGMAELKEPASQWLAMLDSGVTKALDINLALRTYIKTHTPR
jgi:hypothetical protein